MLDTSTRFDFRKRVAYDADAKRRFHRHARAQLLKLAEALGREPASTICAPMKAASLSP